MDWERPPVAAALMLSLLAWSAHTTLGHDHSVVGRRGVCGRERGATLSAAPPWRGWHLAMNSPCTQAVP